MEVNVVDTVAVIKKCSPKERVERACVEDRLHISSEAVKRKEWLERVKEMPDLRTKKIDSNAMHPTLLPSQIAATAHKIAESGF